MNQEVGSITPGSLLLTLCLGILLVGLPRRYAFIPLLVSGCYMTLGQSLIIGGLHFYLVRIIILFGLIRIFIRKEMFRIEPTAIDKVLLAWVTVSSFLFVIFGGTNVEITERLGGFYNALGIYFIARALIRDMDDVVITIRALAIMIIPLAALFIAEHTTGKNPFSLFGGVPTYSEVRNGMVRCQGPFRHSILAGTFGATALPLFIGLWIHQVQNRRLAGIAIVAATVIVVTSASSGPILAYLMSLAGVLFWPFRSKLRFLRWGIIALVLALAVYMKAPVWFLISRISDLVGGGGWYRSALIDAAIRHFDEWWLVGTAYTAHWMPTGLAVDPNSADITNQFIAQGISGGLIAMILFVWLIAKCFKSAGTLIRKAERFSYAERFVVWTLGCSVLGHVASFFSVSYFDQIIIFWYMVVAMIACLVRSGSGYTMTASRLLQQEVVSRNM